MDWIDELIEQFTRDRQDLVQALQHLEAGRIVPGERLESGQWVETTDREIERTRRRLDNLDSSLRRLQQRK